MRNERTRATTVMYNTYQFEVIYVQLRRYCYIYYSTTLGLQSGGLMFYCCFLTIIRSTSQHAQRRPGRFNQFNPFRRFAYRSPNFTAVKKSEISEIWP